MASAVLRLFDDALTMSNLARILCIRSLLDSNC